MVKRVALVILALGLVAVGHGAAEEVTEQDIHTLVLAHQLEKMGTYANALNLIESGDTEKAVRLLEQQLSSAISAADDVILSDVEIDYPFGDLKEGAKRANEYVQSHDVSAETKEQSARVLEHLGAQ